MGSIARGLRALAPDALRLTPPFRAHPLLYDAVEDVLGVKFRKGKNGCQANKRRDDVLLGAALFIDAPDEGRDKTLVYFVSSMIAMAENREVDSPLEPISNYRAAIDDAGEDRNECGSKVDGVESAFSAIEDEIERRLAESDVNKSEVVFETLDGVRNGQSFHSRGAIPGMS